VPDTRYQFGVVGFRDKFKSLSGAEVIFLTASFFTLVFAFWDCLPIGRKAGRPVYDPMVALTAMTVIALIAYTYFTRQTLEHSREMYRRDEERRRRSITTATLAELRYLTARLQNLAHLGSSAATAGFISHPLIDLAFANAALMEPSTVRLLADTHRQLQDIQEYLSTPDRDELVVKTRARWAFNCAVTLVVALQNEGGEMPPAGPEEVSGPEAIEMVADPFARS
jgi:hypothetical protein